jgi:hypothetical protein
MAYAEPVPRKTTMELELVCTASFIAGFLFGPFFYDH